MAKEVKVIAERREGQGTSAVRRMRHKGVIPGVVYGADMSKVQMITINQHDFDQALSHLTSEHVLMDLVVADAKPRKVLLKEVQRHPVTHHIIHVDFMAVSMTEKLRINLPIILLGEPVGVTQEGGLLEHVLREIEVACLPGDIVDAIRIDVSALRVGDKIVVEALPLDRQKFTVFAGPQVTVTTVAIPRVQEEEAPAAEAAAEGAAAAEPEVIREKKEEPTEGKEEGAKESKKEAKKEAKK